MCRRLTVKVRSLPDGRFCVRYYWRALEREHEEHCKDKEELAEFLTKLAMNTEWKP